MARKKKHEEHENHERWLVSYADFITLLFAFFVVMYAVSSVNEGKYRVLSESLVAAFRSPTKSMTPIQVGSVAKSPLSDPLDFRQSPVAIQLPNMPTPRYESDADRARDDVEKADDVKKTSDAARPEANAEQAQQVLAQISHEIEQAMGEMIDKGLISVRRSQHWVEVEINTSILFPSGSATLSRAALPTLEKLSGILKRFPNAIHVEGFTDNVPINNVIFPSNWELSAGRAASVVHLFTEAGLEPQRLVAIGYGEYRPTADNDSPEGRAKNRRVVLVIQSTADTREVTESLVTLNSEAPPAQTASPPQTPPVQHPTNPGAMRAPGKFPVIAPPIRLPFDHIMNSPAGAGDSQ